MSVHFEMIIMVLLPETLSPTAMPLVSKVELFREQRQQYLFLRILQQKNLRTLWTNLLLSTNSRKMDLRIGNWRTHKAKMV